VRNGRAKMALAIAAFLLLGVNATSASATTRPRAGAVVSSPPLLRWTAVSGAEYYNVQLWRQGAHATRKVLSRWPTRHRFQLRNHWRYRGRVRHFTPARYYWYVWPWLGTGYGRLHVRRSFVYGTLPVNTSPPAVAGEAREGATLTATPGTWTGLPQPTLSYRWERCAADGSACATIAGATLPSYRIGADDIDLVVRAVLVGTNIVQAVAAPSPASAIVLAAPPNNVTRPVIAGHPHVGATLTAAAGEWISSRPVTYSYRWLRCSADGVTCSEIARATAKTYAVRNADSKRRIAVVVGAANSGGVNEATSTHSARVGLVFVGTAGADVLHGTIGSDVMRLRAGNDAAYGGRGDDRIFAGHGSDHVYGGRGNDVIKTHDDSRDWVDCGAGIDKVAADRLDRVTSRCEYVTRT
jgi:hemolysin type calcium-binding protein